MSIDDAAINVDTPVDTAAVAMAHPQHPQHPQPQDEADGDRLTDEEMEVLDKARRDSLNQQDQEDLEGRIELQCEQEVEQFRPPGSALPNSASASTPLSAGAVADLPPVLPDGPVLVRMADIEPSPVEWLWPQRIPLGTITVLAGPRGIGKSFLTFYMAAHVSTGSPWPDAGECPKGSVILISFEDDPDKVIRPELDAHYADIQQVTLLTTVRKTDPRTGRQRKVMLTLDDVENLEIALQARPDCKLVIVDPIGSSLGRRVNEFHDNEVRSVLAPVMELAREYGPAMVIVAHHRKSKVGTADDLVLGSVASTALARVVWHVGLDEQDENRRLLLPGKNNLARKGNGLAFTIAGEPPTVQWERDPVTVTADDVLIVEDDGKGGRKKPSSPLESAKGFLKGILAEGPKESALVERLAREQGISERTLNRARTALGVVAYKQGLGDEGRWLMKLPPPPVNPETVVSKFQKVLSTSGPG